MRDVVLVTGGGRRLGRAIAEGLGAAGHDVVVHHARSAAGAAEAVARIRSLGGRAATLAAALDDASACDTLVERAAAAIGAPVSHVVHAASLFEEDVLETLRPDAFAAHMDVNARAGILLARALARHLGPAGRGAAVMILDQKLWNPNPDFLSYTLSKATLAASVGLMARTLAPIVRVNAVAPGYTLPNPGEEGAPFEAYGATLPLGRTARPDEIAATVAFLLGARAVTGQAIVVDGGEHLVPRARDAMYRD